MKFKLAMCQMMPATDKDKSMRRFTRMAEEAASVGADMLVFPEMWTCPYMNKWIEELKEPVCRKLPEANCIIPAMCLIAKVSR